MCGPKPFFLGEKRRVLCCLLIVWHCAWRGVYGKIMCQLFLPILLWVISQLLSMQESLNWFLNFLQMRLIHVFIQCVHTDKLNFKNLAAI